MFSQANKAIIGTLAVLCLIPVQGAAIDTQARAALVIDHATGAVLLDKNADEALPPASMSKLMTLYLVFEALKDGRLELSDTFRVSAKAWSMGGSKMFLREGEQVSVEDLIRGIIVQSGNDACVVLAEGIAGSENAFANQMTRRARELGMMESTFVNSTGWPHPDHRMSARDLVFLAGRMIEEYPEFYEFFAEETFTWDGITQDNRNPLLGVVAGADGLKTGHTEEAGYGLVGSALQDNRRITLMITGLPSSRARLLEAERLMNWAFRDFFSKSLFSDGQVVTQANVWLGEERTVDLVPTEPLDAMIAFVDRDDLKAEVRYSGPIEAPIAKGDKLAELVVTTPQIGETRYDLVAANDVARGGFLRRLDAAARVLASKALSSGQARLAGE